jgi:hypothetical protein
VRSIFDLLAENPKIADWVAGREGLRILKTFWNPKGGIQPELGALFGANESIRDEENCSPWIRLFLGALRFP